MRIDRSGLELRSMVQLGEKPNREKQKQVESNMDRIDKDLLREMSKKEGQKKQDEQEARIGEKWQDGKIISTNKSALRIISGQFSGGEKVGLEHGLE